MTHDDPPEFSGPAVTTSLAKSARARGCRRCDATGAVSDHEGRGVICPACRGTTVAAGQPGDRLRASWGLRK